MIEESLNKADGKHSAPFVTFLFSWESKLLGDEEYPAAFFDHICHYCRSQPIEVYVDRLGQEGEVQTWFETELLGRIIVAARLSTLLIHELVHWAGGDEDAAHEAEYLVEDSVLKGKLWDAELQWQRRCEKRSRSVRAIQTK
jgi:hypothetical protein